MFSFYSSFAFGTLTGRCLFTNKRHICTRFNMIFFLSATSSQESEDQLISGTSDRATPTKSDPAAEDAGQSERPESQQKETEKSVQD